jgi:hypothetical protein
MLSKLFLRLPKAAFLLGRSAEGLNIGFGRKKAQCDSLHILMQIAWNQFNFEFYVRVVLRFLEHDSKTHMCRDIKNQLQAGVVAYIFAGGKSCITGLKKRPMPQNIFIIYYMVVLAASSRLFCSLMLNFKIKRAEKKLLGFRISKARRFLGAFCRVECGAIVVCSQR